MMIVILYNDTPNDRDNFVRLAKAGHYDGSLFYRVIKNFVIPGGSTDRQKAIKGAAIGYGKPIVIDAEIKPEHYHKKGALAAPRQPDRVNFFKESDISQFYIVKGRKYDPKDLDIIEKQVNVQIKRAIQRKYYTTEKKAIRDTLRKQYILYPNGVYLLRLYRHSVFPPAYKFCWDWHSSRKRYPV